jgi:hypothetical protein
LPVWQDRLAAACRIDAAAAGSKRARQEAGVASGQRRRPLQIAAWRGVAAPCDNAIMAPGLEIISPECAIKALLQVKSPDANSYQ